MNNKRTIIWSLAGALTLVILLLAITGVWAEPNPTTLAAPSAPLAVFSNTISFQGRLLDSAGNPVNGTPAMNFRVYTQPAGGTPVWEDGYTVPVENGLFNASLEIPPALFDGQALWLGVQVEGDAQEMTPRQQLLPAPYALYTKNAPWNGLVGVPSDLADGDDDTLYSAGTGLTLAGTQFSIVPAYRLPQGCANGAIPEWNAAFSTWDCGTDDVGSGAAAWLLGGNAGTTPGTDVLGTTDAVSLTLVVNGAPALRLEPAAVPNLIGGYRGNSVTSGVEGATIGGGGASGDPNQVASNYGTVGGGYDNTASSYGDVIGGGAGNTASGNYTTIGGGDSNTASGTMATIGGGQSSSASGNGATIGGGGVNNASSDFTTVGGGTINAASGDYATVGGGIVNTASGESATVGGGDTNTASGESATVGGGSDNTASGTYGTIGGGTTNVVSGTYATVAGGGGNTTIGAYATIGGGQDNTASDLSATIGGGGSNTASGIFATIGGGGNNTASGDHATIGGGTLNTASGELATVAGGWYNTASGESATISGGEYNTASGDYSFAAGRWANAAATGCFVWGDSTEAVFNCSNPDRFMVRASGGVYLYTNSSVSTGAYLAPNSGSWSSLSDRNAKENFESVDPEYVLEQVVQMPVSTWNYIGETEGIRHLGPMAQDFYAAFGLGDSERYINTLDADGVALAAIQGLYAKNQALATENAALQTRVDDLETENATQEKALDDLATENATQKKALDELETRLATLERGGMPQATSTLTTWWQLAGAIVLAGIAVARRRQHRLEP